MKKDFLSFPRDARIYLISQFLLAGFYTWPFWYGFATERITATQFGIQLAVSYVVGMIAEVPTGAFADSFGRRRSALIGTLGGAVYPFIIYFGGDFSSYIIGAIVVGVASAFTSGSMESLIYELPQVDKKLYRKIQSLEPTFWQSGLILATMLGGFLYSFNHFLPFAVQAVSFLLAALLISRVTAREATIEQIVESETRHQKFIRYITTNIQGFKHLFEFRTLWPMLVFGSILSVVMWIGIEFVNEAGLIRYGVAPDLRGLTIAGVKVVTIVLLNMIIIRKLKTDNAKLQYLGTVSIFAFTFYSFGSVGAFFIGFLCFNMVSAVMSNFIHPVIHDHVLDKWRATAISSYNFLISVARAFVSILVGVLLQKNGIVFVQRFLLALLVVCALPALTLYLRHAGGRLATTQHLAD